jgi:hypothetical protein
MIVGRLIGWLFVIAALAAEGHDIWGLWDTGHYQVSALGQLWAEVNRNSLLLLQPAIQRHVAVWLWDWVIFPVLQWPAVITLAVPGILLVWACRRRDRRRRH